MRPAELKHLLTSMAVAADLIEAIDYPPLQGRGAWDLAGWSYDLVPWGVRFFRRDAGGAAAVVALEVPTSRSAPFLRQYARSSWPTTVVVLGETS